MAFLLCLRFGDGAGGSFVSLLMTVDVCLILQVFTNRFLLDRLLAPACRKISSEWQLHLHNVQGEKKKKKKHHSAAYPV